MKFSNEILYTIFLVMLGVIIGMIITILIGLSQGHYLGISIR